jgi:3-isopropylmalate dehydrogenase
VGERYSMFEPIHGSYPQATGKNIANPLASILSAAMLLEHFGLREEAHAVSQAVDRSLREGVVTPDLDPNSKYGTDDVGHFVATHIADGDEYRGLNKENIGLGKSTII